MARNKRLLFISNLFPDSREPYRGLDNATILHHLAGEYEIQVLALRPKLPFLSRPKLAARSQDEIFAPQYLNVPYIPRIGSRWNHRLMADAIRAEVEKAAPRMVLSSWIYPDSCAVSILAKEMGFPFVSIAQGSDVHQYLKMPVRRRIIVESLKAASGVITRSGELARLLSEAGVEEQKVHPIYNGIDFEVFKPGDQGEARHHLGLPESGKIILFVGNFYDIKNPLLLIEAFSRLSHLESPPHLVMIGGGPLEGKAHALAKSNKTKVIFAGRKTATEVATYMRAADLLCLPSKNEGVPNVILEAFACGLPVLASNVGGIPEVLNSDYLGSLAAPDDLPDLVFNLCQMLTREPQRERIHQHGLQFSWQRTARAYAELLEKA